METTFVRADLKARARTDMSGRWGLLIPVTILCNIISIIIYLFSTPYSLGNSVLSLMELILIGPFSYAGAAIFLQLVKGEKASLNDFFAAFSEFEKSLPLWGLMFLKTFLWSLLFIIPGIVKAIAYSQAFYLKLENPELSASEALALSEKLTRGYKADMLVLYLSFIGWYLLGIITFGLAFLYVYPYINTTAAHLYLYLKDHAQAQGLLPAEPPAENEPPVADLPPYEPALTTPADVEENDEYSKESSI